jgi:hypothetical protein
VEVEKVIFGGNYCSCCYNYVGNKLCEDSKKYGADNMCTSGSTLSKAAMCFSKARFQMEKERRQMLSSLGQVFFLSLFILG